MRQSFHQHKTYRRSRAGKEDERSQVSSSLVGESASSVDQSTNTVCLKGRANEGGTPSSGGTGSLLGLEELLLGVGGLGLAVGLAEDWAKDGKGDDVVEHGTKGDSRWLDWWEV